MATSQAVIIGAGILGCSLAYHLARRGMKVLVIEKEVAVARHASGKSSGMLRSLYRSRQLTEWALKSRELLPKELASREISRTGSLIVGRELPDHHREVFEQLETSDPLRAGRADTVVYCSGDGLISSESFTDAIHKLAVSASAEFLFETQVTSILSRPVWEINCRSADGVASQITGDVIINAAGAWINQLAPDGTAGLDTRSYARHLFTIPEPELAPAALPRTGFLWDERDNYYIRQLPDGRSLFSVCDETETAPDGEPSPKELPQRFLDGYAKFSRKFGRKESVAEIESQRWCLRTYLPNKLPILSEHPRCPGYFHFGAFGGFGMSTGFAAADELAQKILSQKITVRR